MKELQYNMCVMHVTKVHEYLNLILYQQLKLVLVRVIHVICTWGSLWPVVVPSYNCVPTRINILH